MAEKTRALALFDFDGTLIPGDSIVSFIRFARRNRRMSAREYASVLLQTGRYLRGGLSDAEMKTRSLRFLTGLPKETRDRLGRDFAAFLLSRVYPEARAEIARHRKEGRLTLLVSASTENYMRPLAEQMDFDALLCTPLEEDGSVLRNCKGEEKARRVTEWLADKGIEADWENSFAYGDSKSDAPMLRLAGHPVLVNPRSVLVRLLPDAPRVRWTGRADK